MSAHRDLVAWQMARSVVVTALRMSQAGWRPHAAAVFAQLQRSALSVQLNIAEGYASGPGARCRHLLEVAYASAVETEDLLNLLSDEQLIPADRCQAALADCQSSQRLLRGLIKRYR